MRISDWSSDVCSSDLGPEIAIVGNPGQPEPPPQAIAEPGGAERRQGGVDDVHAMLGAEPLGDMARPPGPQVVAVGRSEERRVGKECVSTCRSWWSPYH